MDQVVVRKNESGAAETLEALRHQLREESLMDETLSVTRLKEALSLTDESRGAIASDAAALVAVSRSRKAERGMLDQFLQEFGLSNQEGIALMCLAEALLRVPDGGTADELIAEKISSGDWKDHKGRSDSVFVNASTWGLMLTGQVIDLDKDTVRAPAEWLGKLINRAGEPVIRQAMLGAMRIMGGEFVLGRTIKEGLSRGAKEAGADAIFSFDMLGEGARTDAAAEAYFNAYSNAIEVIGKNAKETGVSEENGISVKLSALDPRYFYAQEARVHSVLYPDLLKLAQQAAAVGIGFTIDAEEADRLDISFDLIERLAREESLKGWDGLGLALQAYGKRAFTAIDWLAELGRDTGRRIMVRLVKGAYWDTEIKRAQENGLEGFPVFTRKASTDISYLACAEKLLANDDVIYCQFATHNAHTLAAIMNMAQGRRNFEFQRLHGMGDLLYRVARDHYRDFPQVRIYAPVGNHKDLLAYLVRRLLENGANSSFVNRFLDDEVPVEDVVGDPLIELEAAPTVAHSAIALPDNLFGEERPNSEGFDLSNPLDLAPLFTEIDAASNSTYAVGPLIAGEERVGDGKPVQNPTDLRDEMGDCRQATEVDIEDAIRAANAAQLGWDQLGGAARGEALSKAADLMEADCHRLMAILIREAGKSIPDALSEVREAVDFLRYYGAQAKREFQDPTLLPGPTGEENLLSLHGRGTFLCISPWNFPLAIFSGQVSAALAAGNSVIAKPADPTPIIAYEAVKLMHKGGVPTDVLHLMPGSGRTIGAKLVADPRIAGVAMTGSTETAQTINRTLAGRDGAIGTLIAETGGQNAMFVDSTALPEQVVDDVVASAFQSAGQRCSAMRILCVQEDIADDVIEMMSGAMDAVRVGNPAQLRTDCGPIIDERARSGLVEHIEHMKSEAKFLNACKLTEECEHGTFLAPHAFEIDSVDVLGREQFGPVLHVVRYKAEHLDKVVESVRRTGYGLTMGIHTRIERKAYDIFRASATGNTYVNRNMIGAVVGVQPFGGEGLSGTGPKAGGPHYMHRYATERTYSVNTVAAGGNAKLFCLEG